MNKDIILGIIRHALTAAGGALCANGTMSNDEWLQIIGGVVALISVIWSVLQKRGAAKAVTPIILAFCLGSASLICAGCNTPPETVAYRALGTIGVTASAAHDAWKAYAETGRASAEERAHVSAFWNQYCAAFSLACDAAKTASASKDLTAFQIAAKALENCETSLIAVVKQYLPADLSAALNGGK
ncbi:MAG: hypothetical protein NTY01_09290 [Verrucomicrobia bacterium]|nr:hypothetical protein [Verrucomicrobiota bacterium]